MNHVPRCVLAVSRLEHLIPRPRIVVPAPKGFEVHRTQFPLPQRIGNSSVEPLLLLLHTHFKPNLDQLNAAIDDIFFDRGTTRKKPRVLFRRTETHDVLNARAVIPTPVKNDDLSRRWKMRKIALDEHLALLAVSWRGQSNHAKDPR